MTRHSLVLAAQSKDPATRSRAIEAIAAAYWRPVYKYVRMKWNISPEDAAELHAGVLQPSSGKGIPRFLREQQRTPAHFSTHVR